MKGRVYFVSAPGRVKIGYTVNPENRLAKLRQADMEELTVIGIVAGTRKQEQSLLQSLSAHLVKGEWFRDCNEVRAAIAEFMHSAAQSADGVVRHPSSALDEMAFVAEAARICKRLVEAERSATVSAERAIALVAIKTGLGYFRVWSLQYRKPNFITAAEMQALRSCRAAQALVGEIAPEIVVESDDQ